MEWFMFVVFTVLTICNGIKMKQYISKDDYVKANHYLIWFVSCLIMLNLLSIENFIGIVGK